MAPRIANPQPRTYAPGSDITCRATAPVTARTLVTVAGTRGSGGTDNIAIRPAAAGEPVLGVAVADAAAGELVGVARDGVLKAIAGAAITAGQRVQAGADAKAVPLTTGAPFGLAVITAAANGTVEIAN